MNGLVGLQLTFCVLLTVDSAGKLYGDDLLDPSKYKVEVSSTGTVTYFVAGSTETFCQMNLRTFPFDVQTCYIKLTSWTYSSAQVNLSAYDPVIDTSVYHESGQWNLHDTLVGIETLHF